MCLRRVLLAWLKLVETTKGSDETWLIEHQTRVKMRIFFRALQLLAMIFGKRRVARLAYGIASGAIFLMLLSAALNDMVSNVIED